MDPFSLLKSGKCAELKALIESEPKFLKARKMRGSYSVNLLWQAMHKGKHEIADMLLTAGLKPKGYANTPDINTIASRGDLEMFDLFTVKHGISFLEGEQSRIHEEKFVTVGCGCGQICEHKKFSFKKNVVHPILCDAVQGGNMFIIRKIIPHVNIENENEQGRTALHVACNNNNLDIVKFLLQNKADPNHITTTPKPYSNLKHYGLTPINYTIMLSKENGEYNPENAEKYFDIIRCLISAGGKIQLNFSDILGMELELFGLLYEHFPESIKQVMKLEYLMYSNSLSEIKSLLSNDMYKKLFTKNTCSRSTIFSLDPTSIIINKSHIDILLHLLDFFKNQLVEHDYEVLVIKAALYNNEHILKYIYNLTPLSGTNHLKIAFRFAINNKNSRIVEFLLEKGNKIDKDIFSGAWTVGNYDIIKMFVNAGYDTNQNPELLYLHYGVKNPEEFFRSVKLILDKGFDINNKGYNSKHIIEELVDFQYVTSFVKCRLLCLLLNYPNLNYNTEYVNSRLNDMIAKHEAGVHRESYNKNNQCIADNMGIETSEALNIYVPILRSIIKNKIECCICFCNNEKFSMPCGHPVLCVECAPKVNNCPQCTKLSK